MPDIKPLSASQIEKISSFDLSGSTTPIIIYDRITGRTHANDSYQNIDVAEGVERSAIHEAIHSIVRDEVSNMKSYDNMAIAILPEAVEQSLNGLMNCCQISRMSSQSPNFMVIALMRFTPHYNEDTSIIRGSNSVRAEAQFKASGILLESTERMTRMYHSIDYMQSEEMSSMARRELQVLNDQLDEAMGVLDRMNSLLTPQPVYGTPIADEAYGQKTYINDNFIERAKALAEECAEKAAVEVTRQGGLNAVVDMPESRLMGAIISLAKRAEDAISVKQQKRMFLGKLSIDFKIQSTPSVVQGRRVPKREFLCLTLKDNGELLTAEQLRACMSSVGDIDSMSDGTLSLFSANSMVCTMGGTMMITDNKRGTTTVELQFPVANAN